MRILRFFGSAKGKDSGFYMMTAGNLLAIVLTLYRQMKIAGFFGLSWQTDVFAIALVLPLLIREVVSHTIDASLIPAYSRVMARQGPDRAAVFLNRIATWIALTTGIFCIALLAGSDSLISLISPGLRPMERVLASRMMRILVPMIFLSTLSGIIVSICNYQRRFGLTALIKIAEVGSSLAFILLFSGTMGIMVLPYSVLTGSATLLIALLYISGRLRISYRPSLSTRGPEFRRFVMVALPLFLGAFVLGSAAVVDKAMASLLGEDSITAMDYALKIHNTLLTTLILPMAVVSNVSFADFFSRKDMKGFREEIGKLSTWTMLLTLPVTAALIVLSTPLISVLFQRGAFSAVDSRLVGGVLAFYAPWFLGFSISTILTRAFYAMQHSITPVLLELWGMVVNVLLNVILMPSMGVRGLALGTSIASLLKTMLMLYFLRKRTGHLGGRLIVPDMLKAAAGAGLLLGSLLLLQHFFPFDTGASIVSRGVYLLGFAFTGGAVYAVSLMLLRSVPAGILLQRFRRRGTSNKG